MRKSRSSRFSSCAERSAFLAAFLPSSTRSSCRRAAAAERSSPSSDSGRPPLHVRRFLAAEASPTGRAFCPFIVRASVRRAASRRTTRRRERARTSDFALSPSAILVRLVSAMRVNPAPARGFAFADSRPTAPATSDDRPRVSRVVTRRVLHSERRHLTTLDVTLQLSTPPPRVRSHPTPPRTRVSARATPRLVVAPRALGSRRTPYPRILAPITPKGSFDPSRDDAPTLFAPRPFSAWL